MIKLYNMVTSKKTGLPVVGKVIGILDVSLFLHFQPGNYERWNNVYPNWKEKSIVYVMPKEPQKNVSFLEFVEETKENMGATEEECKILYKYIIPSAKVLAYPIDDLERIE